MAEQLIDNILALKKKCRIEERIGLELYLTAGEIGCLWALDPEEKLVCHDLAERLDLSPSRCSRVIQNLIDKGYLLREENSGDRRSLLISLSPQGRACRRQIEQARIECEQSLLAQLSGREIGQVQQGLQILIRNL